MRNPQAYSNKLWQLCSLLQEYFGSYVGVNMLVPFKKIFYIKIISRITMKPVYSDTEGTKNIFYDKLLYTELRSTC